jgi:hypothetical protein
VFVTCSSSSLMYIDLLKSGTASTGDAMTPTPKPASSSPPPTDGVMDPCQQDACTLEAGLQGEEENEKPEMGLPTAIILLFIATVVCRCLISLTVPRSSNPDRLCFLPA